MRDDRREDGRSVGLGITREGSAEPQVGLRAKWTGRGLAIGFWTVTGISVVTILGLMARPSIRVDWFFDEVWRVDMIRSGWTFDRYFQHNTPLSPGWLVLNWGLFETLPQSREIMRLSALVPALFGWLLIADVLRRRLRPRFGSLCARAIAGATVSTALLLPGQAQLVTFFNNYSFELFIAAGFLWSVALIEDGHIRLGMSIFGALLVVTPFVAQAPLFLAVPATFWVFARADSSDRKRLMWMAGAGVFVMAVTYVFFLRPVREREILGAVSIGDYWNNESLRALSPMAAVRLWVRTLRDAVVPISWRDTIGGWIYFVMGFGWGVVSLWRVFRFWVVAAVASQGVIAVASMTLSWPIGFGRLNTAVGFLFTGAVPLGIWTLVVAGADRVVRVSRRDWSSSKIRARSLATFTAALVVLFSVFAWPTEIRSSASDTAVFARGLSGDLDQLESWANEGDVVLGFHFMSSWYTHDRLVTDGDVPLIVLDELRVGERLINDPTSVVEESAPDAKTVWCVLPYELGPDGVSQRCQLDPAKWQQGESTLMTRAEIRRWVRVSID